MPFFSPLVHPVNEKLHLPLMRNMLMHARIMVLPVSCGNFLKTVKHLNGTYIFPNLTTLVIATNSVSRTFSLLALLPPTLKELILLLADGHHGLPFFRALRVSQSRLCKLQIDSSNSPGTPVINDPLAIPPGIRFYAAQNCILHPYPLN